MHSTLIKRTETGGIRRIGAEVEYSFLLEHLERLGTAGSKLLAEPVKSADASYIDWYLAGRNGAVAIDAAPTEVIASAESTLHGLRLGVEELASDLDRSGRLADRILAAALRDCMTVPDRSFVYVVNGFPVLTAWGYVHDSGPGYRPGLTVEGRLPSTPTSVAQPGISPEPTKLPQPILPKEAVIRRWGGGGCFGALLPLLFLLLVFGILYLLLPACALVPLSGWVPWLNHCEPAGVPTLMQELASLERQGAQEAANCISNPATVAAPTAPSAGQPSDEQALQHADEITRDLKRGDLEITLTWQGHADLDLRADFTCQGQASSLFFQEKRVCGGLLDHDANYRLIEESPAEHIVWEHEQDIPTGRMSVAVSYFTSNDDASSNIPYQVVVRRGANTPKILRGSTGPVNKQTWIVIDTIEN